MMRQSWRSYLRDAPVVVLRTKKAGGKRQAGSGDETKRKRKKRSSSGLMHLLGVGEHRVARGLARAAGEYARRAESSAEHSRDGAVRDAIENLVRAQEHALRQLGKIPRDLTQSRDYQKASKRLRKSLNRFAW